MADPLPAQDRAQLDELKKFHDQMIRPGETLSVGAAAQIGAKLQAWNLPLGQLPRDARAQAINLEIHAALAQGNAARAVQYLDELEALQPGTRQTLWSAWLVSTAVGDAQRAKATLDLMQAEGAANEQGLATRLRRLKSVGHPAPDVALDAGSGLAIPLRARNGAVLVVDVWQQSRAPSDKQSKALRDLVDSFGADPKIRFLGLNTDAAAEVDAARKFAALREYRWPQYYENAPDAKPVSAAFHVGGTPWQVLIDQAGFIRAVGAAGEPAFAYAVRSAVAEAKHEQVALAPKTVEGVGATITTPAENAALPAETARGAGRARVTRPEDKPAEPEPPPPPAGELKNDPDAERLLKEARVYMKTGRKTDARNLLEQIVRDCPNTLQAQEAQEYLDALR